MTVHRGKISVAGAGGQQLISPYIVGTGPSDAHPTVGDWLLIDRTTQEAVRVLDRLNLFKPVSYTHLTLPTSDLV